MITRSYIKMPPFRKPFQGNFFFKELVRNGWIFECDQIINHKPINHIVQLRDCVDRLKDIQERKFPLRTDIKASQAGLFTFVLFFGMAAFLQAPAFIVLLLRTYSWQKLLIGTIILIVLFGVLGPIFGSVLVLLVGILFCADFLMRYKNYCLEMERVLEQEQQLIAEIQANQKEIHNHSFLVCLPHIHVIYQPHRDKLSPTKQNKWDTKTLRLSNQTKEITVLDLTKP